MKKLFTIALFAAMIADLSPAQPSATAGTGVLGFNLNSFGRVRVGAYPYVAADREVDRMAAVAAQSKNAVFDYYEDADSTFWTARILTIAGVDSAVETLADNEYSGLPPKVKMRTTIMGWNNQKYVIVRYTIIADEANIGSLYHGTIVIPRVGKIYGGETVKYDKVKKVAYFYREGEASYWGVKALSPQVFGVRALDWDEYSTDPASDAATDSVRESMMNYSSFDTLLVSGSNGSIYSVNTGKNSFTNVGDSVVLFFALGYGTNATEMNAAIDSATVKYGKISTSVRQFTSIAPEHFSLEQNYPNPFNPSTQITFSIATASHVRLTVFDALGREVSTLADRPMDAGRYITSFDASRLSAGIYFYSLTAGGFTETKKMMLVK